jgi:type IV pilus assembly protein PilC
MLDAGLSIERAFDVLGSQAQFGHLRPAFLRMKDRIKAGADLTTAMRSEADFPPLFLQLVSAGEASGTLDRTLAEATRYYEFQARLWRHFIAQITMPVLQYVLAVLVVSGANYIISSIQGQGHGFFSGLFIGYGIPAVIVATYIWVIKPLFGTRVCHEIALKIPVVGYVARTIALARFSLVFYLMSEAGVPIKESLVRSFEATDNGAFAARGQAVADAVQSGATLTAALSGTGLFPRDYLEVIQVAEESGTLDNRLNWLSNHYGEKAEFALSALAAFLAKLIWAGVAAVIIYFIFKIFLGYVSTLRGFMS